MRVRWIFVAVPTIAFINGVRSQEDGPREGAGTPVPVAAPDQAPTAAPEEPLDGADTEPPAPGGTPSLAETPSPATPAPDDGDDTDGVDDSGVCSAGVEGTSGDGVVVCCGNSCDSCSNDEGCDDDDNDECCPSAIFSSAASCDDRGPPCIYGSGDEDDEGSASSDDSDSGTSTGVIALGVILAALLLGNAVYCCIFKRREKLPTAIPPVLVRDRNADGAETGRLQNADAEILRLQEELENERNRRMKADGIIQRAKGGGIRPGDFPSVRDVDLDLENLPGDAIKWVENACAIGGTHLALPATVKSVLESTFLVCREEVKQCFDKRLQSLSGFLGNDEPVALSGGESMNLDTQYVLYECLRRNFRTIVSTEPDHVKELAGMVQRRSEGGAADGNLAGDLIFGDAWPLFDNLVKKIIVVFIEMALQQPAMDFHDDLGESRTYDSILHRDWAPHLKAPMEQCCVVFPAILQQEGRPKSNAKIGVVRLPA